jgi:hypothetical protein
MRYTLTYILSFTFFVFLTVSSFSQKSLSDVFVANGGNFSDDNINVKIGNFDPGQSQYSNFSNVTARSVQDAIIDSNKLYVAADSLLIKYNADDQTELARTTIPGIRQIASYGDKIIATRRYGVTSDHIQIHNTNDLSKDTAFTSSDGCEGVVVIEDSAFISLPGASTLAKVNLVNYQYTEFAPISAYEGVESLYSKGDSSIVSISTLPSESDSTHINEFYLNTYQIGIISLQIDASDGVQLLGDSIFIRTDTDSDFKDELVWGVSIDQGAIVNFSFHTDSVSGDLGAAEFDPLNNEWYLTTTDFQSFGKTHIMSRQFDVKDSFDVEVSPEALALYYTGGTDVADRPTSNQQLNIYPNPVEQQFVIELQNFDQAVQTVRVYDITGQQKVEQPIKNYRSRISVNVDNLSPGMFLVEVEAENGQTFQQKLIKQ